jgi:hypothetical protein
MPFIPGKKLGSENFLYEGFTYHQNKFVKRTGVKYFKCTKKDCKATGVLAADGKFKVSQKHLIHEADFSLVKRLFETKLKERAQEETTPLSEIYIFYYGHFPNSIRAFFIKLSAIFQNNSDIFLKNSAIFQNNSDIFLKNSAIIYLVKNRSGIFWRQ